MTYSSNNINPKTRKKAVQSAATKGYYGTKYASPISTPLPNNTGYYKPQSHTQSQSLNNTPYKLGGTKAEDVYIANSISMTETAGIQNIYYTSQKHTQSQSLNNTPYKLGGTKAEDVYIANSIQNIYYTPQKRTQSQNNTPYNTLNTHTQSYISSLIERNNGNQFGSISADENVNYNNRTKGYYNDNDKYDGFECANLYHVCWICTTTSNGKVIL
eukprot:180216_1